MTKKQKQYKNINSEFNKELNCKIYTFDKKITSRQINKTVLQIFQEEVDLVKYFDKTEKINICLNIKHAKTEHKIIALRTALCNENLVDPLFINNIMLFIKNSNTYTDEFYKNENIFFNDDEEYSDIKLALKQEIKEFATNLVMYLTSILMYYHTTLKVNLDTTKPLPLLYKSIFLSYDLMTILMAFSKAKNFSTKDCYKITDSASILNQILSKFNVSYVLLENFLKTNTKLSFLDRVKNLIKRK